MKGKILLWMTVAFACASAVFFTAAFVWRQPVLFHILAETDCACGDYHAEVSGLAVFNPLRNRLPEQSAEKFLEDLRNGTCSADASLCHYAMEGHRVSDWRLSNLREDGNHAALYYKLTKLGVNESRFRLTGEGVIELTHAQDGWTVANYSSYF